MSDEHTQPHTTIRTFAQDLATARGKRNQGTPDDSSADSDKKAGTAPAAEKESFKAQAPQQTTRTEPTIVAAEKKPPENNVGVKKESIEKTPESARRKIPAFVELKQKASREKSHPTPTIPKISISKKPKKPGRTNIGYDSEIITDNKNKRFNLFSAVGSSLKSWFYGLSVSKKKRAPVYTVPDTQIRKGIIQRATSKSGSVFTTDSAELRAKIKQRQKLKETARSEKIAEEPVVEEEWEISWSPYTDSGFSLLKSPEETAQVTNPQNVVVEFKKQTQPAVPTPTLKPLIPPVPLASATEPVPKPPTEKIVDTQSIDSRWEPKPAILSVASAKPEPATIPSTETRPDAVSQPTAPKPQEYLGTDSNRSTIETLDTNTLALSIVAGLSCVIVLFFAGKIIFEYSTATELLVSSDTTSYLQSAVPNPVAVTQTSSITDIPLRAGVLLGIDYVDTQLFTPDGAVVPPAAIISALKFNALPSFTQSLTDIRFAQINNSAPIIIFEFTDADTILGGFLAWEDTMAQDLREIYLITQLSNLTFFDSRIGNKDVRILTSPTGQVLAVYGIVSGNTAIITGSSETFTQVVNASFSD